MKVVKKYTKKIEFESKEIKNKINQLEKEISFLESKKIQFEKEYKSLENKHFKHPYEIYMQKMHLLNLKNKISDIELELKKRENDLVPLKETLAGKNAEKKAIEKYTDRKEKEIIKQQTVMETELANQIFNRSI